jgi:hypothetical protein
MGRVASSGQTGRVQAQPASGVMFIGDGMHQRDEIDVEGGVGLEESLKGV